MTEQFVAQDGAPNEAAIPKDLIDRYHAILSAEVGRPLDRDRCGRVLRAASFHEAGHAIVGSAVGLPVEFAQLLPDFAPHLNGVVRVTGGYHSPWAVAANSLAGPVVDGLLDPDASDPDELLWEAELCGDPTEDVPRAVDALSRVYSSPGHARNAFVRTHERLCRWIQRHWAAIEAMGEKLLMNGHVSYAELEEISCRHSLQRPDRTLIPRRFWPSTRGTAGVSFR